MMQAVIDALMGEFGGLIALSAGIGAVLGYWFAMTGTVREAKSLIAQERSEKKEALKALQSSQDEFKQYLLKEKE